MSKYIQITKLKVHKYHLNFECLRGGLLNTRILSLWLQTCVHSRQEARRLSCTLSWRHKLLSLLWRQWKRYSVITEFHSQYGDHVFSKTSFLYLKTIFNRRALHSTVRTCTKVTNDQSHKNVNFILFLRMSGAGISRCLSLFQWQDLFAEFIRQRKSPPPPQIKAHVNPFSFSFQLGL